MPNFGEVASWGDYAYRGLYANSWIQGFAFNCNLRPYIQWGYFLMAQQTLEFFDCKDNLEETLLIADPTVKCWKGRHAAHLPLAGGSLRTSTGISSPSTVRLYAPLNEHSS